MQYKFRCNRCSREYLIDIPVSQYDNQKNKLYCQHCVGNTLLERVIEWDGLAKDLGGYSDVGGKASWQR